MTGEPSPSLAADQRLERAIGPWALGANAVNCTVGGGIFALPGIVAGILGPSAILAYVICGIAVALVLTCFIEIGTFVDRSGGAVAYIEEAFGPMMGFLAWLLYSVGFVVTADAALGNVLVDSAASTVPAIAHGAPRIIAMLVVFGGLAAVNIRGIRQGMGLAVATTIAKLLPLLFIIAGGSLVMRWRELQWTGWPPAAKLGEASLILFLAFGGAEQALTPSGEIRDPAHTVPRAMYGATVAFIVLYVALQMVSLGVLGSELGRQSAPLVAVGAAIAGPAGRQLMLAGITVSILGALAGGMVAAPRAFFLAAQDGMLPAQLAKVHPRFRTPHAAIVTVAALIFLLAVSGAFKPLAIASSAAILCVYLAVCLGALRLRYTRNKVPGAFRAPGGPVVAVLGASTVVWLLAHSTLTEMSALAATLTLAIAYYAFRRRTLARSRGV
jgi:amino acid transporter